MICERSRVIPTLRTSCREVHLRQAAAGRQSGLGGRPGTGRQVAERRERTFRG